MTYQSVPKIRQIELCVQGCLDCLASVDAEDLVLYPALEEKVNLLMERIEHLRQIAYYYSTLS